MESANEIIEVKSKEWYMAAYVPQGIPTYDHLKLRTQTISLAVDSIPDGHIAVEMLFVSVDPYLRMRMSGCNEGLYMPQFDLGQVIKSVGIGKVVKSKDSDYTEGDIVLHFSFPVAEYCVFPTDPSIRKIDPVERPSPPNHARLRSSPRVMQDRQTTHCSVSLLSLLCSSGRRRQRTSRITSGIVRSDFTCHIPFQQTPQ